MPSAYHSRPKAMTVTIQQSLIASAADVAACMFANPVAASTFEKCVAGIRAEVLKAGIKPEIVNAAFRNIKFDEKAVRFSRIQNIAWPSGTKLCSGSPHSNS